MSDLFLSIAIVGMALLCVSVVVFILIYGTDEINVFKWRRKRKPEKPMPKYLDLVWIIQERQREAEKLDRERDELIKLYGG